MEQQGGMCSPLRNCLHRPKDLTKIKGKIFVQQSQGESAPGRAASVKLHSSSIIDPETGEGKLSGSSSLRSWKTGKNDDGVKIIGYKVEFRVEPDFGIPEAFRITNMHKRRFFLQSAEFHDASKADSRTIRFYCHSWVYPCQQTMTDRLFFSNNSYLPSQTPKGLEELRKEELASLRGDGIEAAGTEEWVRIYDYDHCNDTFRKNDSNDGGHQNMPYPCRGRTKISDSKPEGLELDVYVPPDERLSPKKMSELISNSIQAFVHFLLPEAELWLGVPSKKKPELISNSNQATDKAKSSSDEVTNNNNNFEYFDDILEMFKNSSRNPIKGLVKKKLKSMVKDHDIFKKIVEASKEKEPKEWPKPQIVAEREMAWKEDEEFARQMLAGTNPVVIQCLDNERIGSSISKEELKKILDGLTSQQAIDEKTIDMAIEKKMVLFQAIADKKVFILDHLSYLEPVLKEMKKQNYAATAYASQTLLLLKKNNTLTPLAIKLLRFTDKGEGVTDKDKENGRVFYPSNEGVEGALWQMAKTHVAVNDSCHHHLISHWLKTHAVVEPFIIATRRQLSAMHPIHRLLAPHFKGTMHVNALARSVLINPGGILEKLLATGKFSMMLSSEVYKTDWRFDQQGLPKDLVKRGMALEDPKEPAGVRLLFEDYPYGADGLDIWVAIKNLVTDFCLHFYTNDKSVESDNELQEWWKEIQNVGHGDKGDEKWWYQMTTLDELTEALTTLIWTATALHAAVNFGQYAYSGYPPNRPTLCRKLIPDQDKYDEDFRKNPSQYYLQMLPGKFEMRLSAALAQVLSQHSLEEVYLGQRSLEEWRDDEKIQGIFTEFRKKLRDIEKKVTRRNRDPILRNRWGPAKILYKSLFPDVSNKGHKGGLTGRGIPNSISV